MINNCSGIEIMVNQARLLDLFDERGYLIAPVSGDNFPRSLIGLFGSFKLRLPRFITRVT